MLAVRKGSLIFRAAGNGGGKGDIATDPAP
jgi:hypothetical protein